MEQTGTVTIHDLLRETALNVNALIGRFTTDRSSTGDEITSSRMSSMGVTTPDVQSAWVIVPELGVVRSCESVDGSVLKMRSSLDISSDTEFWLSRESPVTLAAAVKQTLASLAGSYSILRDVVLTKDGLDDAVGGTGSWSWIGSRLHVRIEGVSGVPAVFIGERTFDSSEQWSGGVLRRGWEYDPSSNTLELIWPLEVENVTVRTVSALMSARDLLDMEPLGAEAGEMLLGNVTEKGEPYTAGVTAAEFYGIVQACGAAVLDMLGVNQGYEEAITMQRQATSRRNRARGTGKRHAVGRLS